MRDCKNCKHYVEKVEIGKGSSPEHYWGCDSWECEFEPTTKNDLPHCQHTDEEIAKSFIEDVEAVKDQLSCGEQMDFPNTFDEFAKDYGFKDKDEIYTNGSELIPVFRVKQWLEHISTTKNDLGVDCISRKAVLELLEDTNNGWIINEVLQLPSVTPQEPTDNDVVLTYDMYHDLIADRAEKLEQELILDKIRAEIDNILSDGMIHKKTVLGIIDKYKAESEE